jgi:putative transcriptional regulator
MKERGRTTKSLAGQLLLANPTMRDPNFRRTVILMSAHDGAGALGAVLNRPLGQELGALNADFALTPLARVPLYCGGPVEPAKLILAAWQTRADVGEFQLNFGLEPERAAGLVGTPGVTIRAFLGYAGWGKGQLENEMRHQTWLTAPVEDFNLGAVGGPELWRMILGSLGPEMKLLADEPDDPAVN